MRGRGKWGDREEEGMGGKGKWGNIGRGEEEEKEEEEEERGGGLGNSVT
jgi:hypothetical protein